MDAYGRLFDRVLWPLWEGGLRRRPIPGMLRYLEATQWRSLDELHALQAADLRKLVAHAAHHIPFYRDRFAAAGLSASAVRTPADLSKLPVLTRDEARDSTLARTSPIPPLPEIHKSTSGTMGKPLVFGYERRSEDWRQAIKLRGYRWAGYALGARSLHYWGAGNPHASTLVKAKADLDHRLKRERYVDCGTRGPQELQAVADLIARHPPEVILCYSQAGADLARYVMEKGLRRWGDIPVLCGAERLYPTDRQALCAAFGPGVFETYGCREVMLIASECEAHQGLHVSMENLIVEVLVELPDGGHRPAEAGELGLLVVTDLHNLAMPFIRYANGDLAVMGPASPCPCGRAHPRLESVEGRVTETLRDGQGRRVNGLVFNVVIAHLAHAMRQFQVVQAADRSIRLRIVPTGTFDESIRQTLLATAAKYLPGIRLTLELVEEIPTSKSGKRQVVVVES